MDLEGIAERAFRKLARVGVFWTMQAYFSRITVKGLEHLEVPGPKVVAANHYGGKLDSMLLWTYVGRKVGDCAAFPGKKELFRPAFRGALLRAAGAFPVDREHPGNIIDEFVKALENGGRYDGTLSIHFEGRTTPKGLLVGKAKTGYARAALRLPEEHRPSVIPAAVGYKRGTYHALPAFRAQASIELLEPVDVAPWKERYGTYDPAVGETEGQHAVAQGLTEYVKSRIIENLKARGIPAAPGFPYGILP
jgi:1-acyl-sn-glycerol-3-phosphate acyltransferase